MEPTANGKTDRGTRARSMVLLGVVFLLGMICGGSLFFVGGHFAMRRGFMHEPMPGDSRHMTGFVSALDLDEGQEKQVQEILTRARDEMMQHLFDTREELRSILRDDQIERFDRMHPPHQNLHGMPQPDSPPRH